MQPFSSSQEALATWKRDKQKTLLNRSILQAGFCPSHYLISKLTIIRDYFNDSLKEEFYLNYSSDQPKLLLRSYLVCEIEQVKLILEICGQPRIEFQLCEKESLEKTY